MKKIHKRGIPIPTRILISAILLVLQFYYITAFIYDYTVASTWAFALSTVISIITVIVIVNRRGNPDHKIQWLIFILVFPVFGISVFLLWGGGRVLPHIKKRRRKTEIKYKSLLNNNKNIISTLRYHDLLHSRQAEYLIGESGFPIYENTSSEYFPPIESFLPRLLEELNNAQKYIYFQFFILAEGKMWEQIHTVLRQKAKEGVEVKIIFDDFGSIKRQNKGFINNLKAENIQVAVFNPIHPLMNIFMNNRNHQKIIVIDGNTAITGGFNIGDEYVNYEKRFGYWLDCAVVLKGEAVNSFLAMFCSTWEFTTRKAIDMKAHICESNIQSDGFVIPYADDPLNDNNPAEGIYMQILNTAQKYVYIATPYLIIDNAMKNILMMAAKSGIDVKIVTPKIGDKWYVHNVTRYNYLELLEAGVKIYEYTPGFIHSKIFVSDDKVATVGTVNMDYRSFVFHFECGAWICNNDTVTDIMVDMLKTIEASKEIKIEELKKRSVFERLLQAILHLFAPFM